MSQELAQRVLVVDDEPSVLETLSAILRLEGYEVASASGVEEALRYLRAGPFDVVLTDLRLEDASGLSIVGELRRHWPETRAVILTGYASLESAIDALREGAYDYLVKPCNVDELKATIARAAERVALGRSLAERMQELEVANAHIQGFADNLQEQVAQATAELRVKVAELSEAKRQLEQAMHARDEFLSVAAHELKTPIGVMRGFAQLTLRRMNQDAGVDPALVERTLTTVHRQSEKLSRLVTQLLDIARIEAGKLVLEPIETDITAMVEEVVTAASLMASQHTLSFHASAPVMAVVDPLRLEQVVTNLVDNAVKYSPKGGPVEVRIAEPDPDSVAIIVRDHGVGIAPEHRQHIFDRFYQADTSLRAGGMGLGLHISRYIVDLHGGNLSADFPPDGGTCFTVTLPCRIQREDALARVNAAER